MADSDITNNEPIAVDVIPGRKSWRYVCEENGKQPFCESAHKGTDCEPMMFESDEARTIWFRVYKKTGDRPFCDGTYNSL
ncbi:MAG: glutamate synthase [Alphaproteobacteria bacterium]|nr:glutamate synthase [Alphaproteobacteria bacterium]HCP00485.1 glutamate synthase [Rhodospirillaceae bacterium]